MSRKLTLRQAHDTAGISVRKLAFLVRTGLIDAQLEGEKLLVDLERRLTDTFGFDVPVILRSSRPTTIWLASIARWEEATTRFAGMSMLLMLLKKPLARNQRKLLHRLITSQTS